MNCSTCHRHFFRAFAATVFIASGLVYAYQPSLPDTLDRVLVSYGLSAQEEKQFNVHDTIVSPFWNVWNIAGNKLDYISIDPAMEKGKHALDGAVFGFENTSDAQTVVRAAWGASGLYLLFIVTDDIFVDMVDTKTVYKNDGTSFSIDPHSLMEIAAGKLWLNSNNAVTHDMVQIQQAFAASTEVGWFSVSHCGKQKNEWFEKHYAHGDTAAQRIQVKIVRASKNVQIQEWLVPWKKIGPKGMAQPQLGSRSSFSFMYYDRDDAVKGRTDILMWRQATPYGFQTPENWNEIEFSLPLRK